MHGKTNSAYGRDILGELSVNDR